MNELLAADVEALLEARPGPCISLYCPTVRSGARTPQGPIYLKKQLSQVADALRANDLNDMAVSALLGPLEELVFDTTFWNTRQEGIAIFVAPAFLRILHLPGAVPDRWSVGEHFFLKPLLPLVAGDDVFHVLALSQNETRLLEATVRTVRRIEGRELPEDLVAALGSQETPQYLLYHTASSASAGQPAIYHGQGAGEGAAKEELRRYLRQIESAIRKLLASGATPLVLAGAEPLPSIFREISTYPRLAPEVIAGNPEHMTDGELRDRAWRIVEPGFQETRRRMAERFGELAGTGRASSDVREILPAARNGRVEALFLDCDADLWGRVDAMDNVTIHAAPEKGDEDLLDETAVCSLRNGGTVYGLRHGEIPGGGDLAAVFRY